MFCVFNLFWCCFACFFFSFSYDFRWWRKILGLSETCQSLYLVCRLISKWCLEIRYLNLSSSSCPRTIKLIISIYWFYVQSTSALSFTQRKETTCTLINNERASFLLLKGLAKKCLKNSNVYTSSLSRARTSHDGHNERISRLCRPDVKIQFSLFWFSYFSCSISRRHLVLVYDRFLSSHDYSCLRMY